jgi:hypothetical protein
MELTKFFEAVEASKDMEGRDISDEDVKIQYMGDVVTIPIGLIEQCPWDILFAAITNRGPITLLRYMTRVVGYYSRTENWNKSKIGELKDRHRGDYTLTEC